MSEQRILELPARGANLGASQAGHAPGAHPGLAAEREPLHAIPVAIACCVAGMAAGLMAMAAVWFIYRTLF